MIWGSFILEMGVEVTGVNEMGGREKRGWEGKKKKGREGRRKEGGKERSRERG